MRYQKGCGVSVLLVAGLGFFVATNSGSRPRNRAAGPDHQENGYSGASHGPGSGN
ncbi:Uncharacterised protein [Mycobacteroides abscessus subsp. abscessus]|nr:Uncharacterised protein [Mycobacteroides abscessus subsp. abscessus]